MKKSGTTNTFDSGLIMDLNPMVTPNDVVTNALNATLVTFNGNENALQNDMGNGRVEGACLPEGYIPLGTAELGGIIYIVSYNPLKNKCQIGSFPSPERNVSSSEVSDSNKSLILSQFYESYGSDYIITPTKRLILFDTQLHPGDKFQIYCPEVGDSSHTVSTIYETGISSTGTILSAKNTILKNVNYVPRFLKLLVVSIEDDGTITDLTKSLNWYNDYYILSSGLTTVDNVSTLDEYRNIVSSNYNTYSSKTSGKLAILGQLECIDSFSVSWDVQYEDDGWTLYLLTNWTYENDYDNNKINLYSVRIIDNDFISEESTETYNGITDVIIHDYPKRYNYLDTLAHSDNPIEVDFDFLELNAGDNVQINGTTYTTRISQTNNNNSVIWFMGDDSEAHYVVDNNKVYAITDLSALQAITNDNNPLGNENNTFYNPVYLSSIEDWTKDVYTALETDGTYKWESNGTINNRFTNGGIINKRLNDGTDNQFIINTGIKLDSTGIHNYTIYPGMAFGYLKYLGQTISINMDSLGSGDATLKEYRYYVSDNIITFNWGLEAYPERHKYINSVQFNFYKYSSDCYEIINFLNSDANNIDEKQYVFTQYSNSWLSEIISGRSRMSYSDGTIGISSYSITPNFTYTINDQSSYSGNYSFSIEDQYDENSLYFVSIVVNYNNEKLYTWFRFMYTSGLFNDYYYNTNDFSIISLNNVLPNIFTYKLDSVTVNETSLNEFRWLSPETTTTTEVEIKSGTMNSDGSATLEDGTLVNPGTSTEVEGNKVTTKTIEVEESSDSSIRINTTVTITEYTEVSVNNVEIWLEENDTYKYINRNKYFGLINGTLVCESSDSTFTPIISGFENESDSYSEEYAPSQTTIQNNSSTVNTVLDDATVEISNTSYSLNNDKLYAVYSLTVDSPIEIQYNYYTLLNIPYKLTRLNVTDLWLLVYGDTDDGTQHVYIDHSYNRSYSDGVACISYQDDDQEDHNFDYYSEIYNYISDLLLVYDVVAIKFRYVEGSRAGNEGHFLFVCNNITYGSNSKRRGYKKQAMFQISNDMTTTAGGSSDSSGTTGSYNDGTVLLYAIRHSSGSPYLFTFGRTGNLQTDLYLQWYGRYLARATARQYLESSRNNQYRGYTDSENKPFAVGTFSLVESVDSNGNEIVKTKTGGPIGTPVSIESDSSDALNFISAPFTYYYKLVNSSNSKDVYEWSIASYYGDNTLTITYYFTFSCDLDLSTNGVVISNLGEDKTPKNIYYNPQVVNQTVTYSFSKTISSESYINHLYNNSVAYTQNEFTGELLELTDPSTRQIYDAYGNTLSYLKQDDGMKTFNSGYESNTSGTGSDTQDCVYTFENLYEYDSTIYKTLCDHFYSLNDSLVSVKVDSDGLLYFESFPSTKIGTGVRTEEQRWKINDVYQINTASNSTGETTETEIDTTITGDSSLIYFCSANGIQEGDTLTVRDNELFTMTIPVYVKNDNSESIYAKVVISEINLPSGFGLVLCLGSQCWAEATETESVLIEANSITTNYIGYVGTYANGANVIGTGVIKYNLYLSNSDGYYDADNPADTITVTLINE